jgi:hypothetical protein
VVEKVSLLSCVNRLGGKICAGALAWPHSKYVIESNANEAIQFKQSVNVDVEGKIKSSEMLLELVSLVWNACEGHWRRGRHGTLPQ